MRFALIIDLARAPDGEYVSLKDISLRQGISVKYLEQIVPQLVRAGLVKSTRGSQGGYMLSKDTSHFTPGDVIRAIEGKIAVIACLNDGEIPASGQAAAPPSASGKA